MGNRIRDIRQRLEKATPGPWDGVTDHDEVMTFFPVNFSKVAIDFTDRFNGQWEPNIDLIINAPTDIRHLLDVIAERDAEIARLRRENKNVLNDPGMREAYLSQFGSK
jgi:hypothetical protein